MRPLYWHAAVRLGVLVVASLVMAVPSARAEDPPTSLARGLYLEKAQGDLEAALRVYRAVADRADLPGTVRSQALLRLAGCALKLGRRDRALEALTRLRRDFSDAQTRLAAERLATRLRDGSELPGEAPSAAPQQPPVSPPPVMDAAQADRSSAAVDRGQPADAGGVALAALEPGPPSAGGALGALASAGSAQAVRHSRIEASAAEPGVVLGIWHERGDVLLVDRGRGDGLVPGDRVAVYRGRLLLATAEVLECEAHLAGARLVFQHGRVEPGDRVLVPGGWKTTTEAQDRGWPPAEEIRRRLQALGRTYGPLVEAAVADVPGDSSSEAPSERAEAAPPAVDYAAAIEELYRERRRTIAVRVVALQVEPQGWKGLDLPWRLAANREAEALGAAPEELVVAFLEPVPASLVAARIAGGGGLSFEEQGTTEIANGRRGAVELGTWRAYVAREPGPDESPADRGGGVGGPGATRMARSFQGVRVELRPLLVGDGSRLDCQVVVEVVQVGEPRRFQTGGRILAVPDVAVTRARITLRGDLPAKVLLAGLPDPFAQQTDPGGTSLCLLLELRLLR